MASQKTVLFFPLNSSGHINSCLGIADRLKQDHGLKTVFLLLGPMQGTSIVDHGHQLITLEEAKVYEDYEISEDEDPCAPIDEELMKRKGKVKRKFPGASKSPQIILRYQNMFRLEPVEATCKCFKLMGIEMVGELAANHDNYARAIESVKPDLIIVDAYFVPPCIVKLKQTPWVKLYSANPLILTRPKLPGGVRVPATLGFKLYTKQEREHMRNNEPDRWQSIVDEWSEAGRRIAEATRPQEGETNHLAEFFKKYDCPPPPPGQQSHESPHLNIYMYPEALDYDQDEDLFEYPARVFRCDSLMRKPTGEKYTKQIQEWEEKINSAMKGKKEIVFFSLGTLASGDVKLMKRFVDILKLDTDRLYLFSKGINGDRYQLNEANMLGANYIPQAYFLQRANLAIVHGGNNSVTECMYYGLPTIVMPLFFDQRDNAQRIEDLKLGRKLDVFGCSGPELLQAIDEILADKDMIDRARKIGQRMQSNNQDPEKISLILKKLIEDHQLDQSFIDKCRSCPLEDIKNL